MSSHTDIQWSDSTVNPVMGCDGCELWIPKQGVHICYAGFLHGTRGKTNSGFARNFDKPQVFAGRTAKAARWSDLTGQNRPDKPWLNGMPRLIFVSDMGDALSHAIPFEYLQKEIVEVAASPRGRRHVWQWLTKQPGRMAEFSEWLDKHGVVWPDNLWAGTSVTTPKTVNRVKALIRVGGDTTTRFLSVEPQWEEIDLTEWLPKLDWIIQGGQSGKDARPFDLAWARSMFTAARRAGVPYFLKQLGAHVVDGGRRLRLRDRHGGDWGDWPGDLRVREVPKPPTKTDARSSDQPEPPAAELSVDEKPAESPHRHLPMLQSSSTHPGREPAGVERSRPDAPLVTAALAVLRAANDADGTDGSAHIVASGTSPAPARRPPHVATQFALPVGTRTAWVDPATLDEHAAARRYFDLGTEDEASELVASVRGRTYKRLLVTGERCASPPGIVLDGRRLRRAALQAGVPIEVEYLDDLDADREVEVIIHANIAAGLARRLTERRKAELERLLIEGYGRRQGQRSDLTSAEISGSSGETRQIVAAEMGESRNAVDDRQVIFFSPVSSELLKDTVDDGRVRRSAAARIVRDAQREEAVAAVLDDARRTGTPFEQITMNPAIVRARGGVFTEAEKLLRGDKKPRKTLPHKPVMTQEAWGALVADAAALNLLGKKVLIQIERDRVHAVVVGVADSDPTAYDPLAPTTRLSWVVDVQAAVDLLQGELRSQVTVGEVEALDPVRCPHCGGTTFYRAGDCVRCRPMFDRAGMVQEIEDAEWRSKRALYDQLARSAEAWQHACGYTETALREAKAQDDIVLMHALKVCEHEYAAAVNARQPEIDAAMQAAAAADRRWASPYGTSMVNLRYPRTRVVLKTARANLPVTLWECALDSGRSQSERSPAVAVGDHAVIVLNRAGSFAPESAAQPWNHCRSALRGAVHQALTRWLARVTP